MMMLIWIMLQIIMFSTVLFTISTLVILLLGYVFHKAVHYDWRG